MPTVVLGRDQVLTLDGVTLEGVREIDLDYEMQTQDVTAWWHAFKSTLPVLADVSAKVLIFWKENYDDFADKLNRHPPEPMTLGISNAWTADFVPVSVRVVQPINGVVAWEVSLKLWTYGQP